MKDSNKVIRLELFFLDIYFYEGLNWEIRFSLKEESNLIYYQKP